ncbi:hypothetical protein NUACC26_048020 [Scytonema sp. NUACC26]
MKVQKGILPESNRPVWMVLDDEYLPIEPIQKYLHYLDSVGRSPNTIQTYAHNLKLFWGRFASNSNKSSKPFETARKCSIRCKLSSR